MTSTLWPNMQQLPSGLSAEISLEEPLARFLTSSRQYNSHGPKPVAFMPNPADGTTSVFRHDETPMDALWKIGSSVIGDRELKLHGAAIVTTRVVTSLGLDAVPDEPPLRHAVISNWPSDVGIEKARRLEMALQIASVARMFLR